MRPALEACDIIVFRGGSLLSRAIRALTRAPGEEPSWANHVGFVVDSGQFLRALVQEAVTRVRRDELWTYRSKQSDTTIRIYRPLGLTDGQRALILESAALSVGRSYGYGKLVLYALDWVVGQVARREAFLFRRLGISSAPVCSWDLAHHWLRAGLSFGVPPGQATPDDIDDFCRQRTDIYRMIYEGRI